MSTTTLQETGTRREQAESRLLVIRNALMVADEELVKVLEGADWEVFGLASFRDYCSEMLPELSVIRLRKDVREARIDALLGADPTLTIPDLVAATGASLGTVHAYLKKVQGGRTRAPKPPVVESRADQVVRLVAAAGERGLTVKELCNLAGLHHGQASGALSRVNRQGRVLRRLAYRDDCAVYVVAGR